MKYPLSHNAGKRLSEYFYDILTFHVPPAPDVRILDPMCGKRYLWEKFMKRSLRTGEPLIENYSEVVFSDIRDLGHNIVSDFRDLDDTFKEESIDPYFDGILFDPPFLFGLKDTDDPRSEDYGGYTQTYAELSRLIISGNELFPHWLKPDGKLIVKCSDQYQTEEREFYPHHITWCRTLSNFNIIDLFVNIHHHLNPTAFQVKDRSCSVITHSYFMVFEVIR